MTGTSQITGSIQAKGDIYYAVLRLPTNNGKTKQKWISTKIHVNAKTKRQRETNRRDAERSLASIIDDYKEKSILQSDELFLNCLANWIEREKEYVRPNTWDAYDGCYRVHIKPYFSKPKFKKLTVAEITPMHIQGYIDAKRKEGQSVNSIKHHMRVLNGTFKDAMKFNLIPFNPCDRVNLPKLKKHVGKAYTAEQAKQLLKVIKGDPLEPAIMLGLFLGLRKSECLGLRWEDIDFDNDLVHIRNTVVRSNCGIIEKEQTKSEAGKRDLHLMPALKTYLIDWYKRREEMRELIGDCYVANNHVCCWIDGRPLEPSYPSHHFPRILKNNNLPKITFHELRHTAGSLLINAGEDAKRVQEYLGHQDVSTTLNIYTHLTPAVKRETGNLMNSLLKDD